MKLFMTSTHASVRKVAGIGFILVPQLRDAIARDKKKPPAFLPGARK